jgi:hypothetical protein
MVLLVGPAAGYASRDVGLDACHPIVVVWSTVEVDDGSGNQAAATHNWGDAVGDRPWSIPLAHVNADVDDGTEMSRPRLAFLRLDEARLIP